MTPASAGPSGHGSFAVRARLYYMEKLMQQQHGTPRRPHEVVRYGNQGKHAHIDSDDLRELRELGVPPETWFLAQGVIYTLLPDGKRISIARLITEAPAGMRVRHRSADPGELRRFSLHLRPSKCAKQCGRAAKEALRELATINRQMQARIVRSWFAREGFQ